MIDQHFGEAPDEMSGCFPGSSSRFRLKTFAGCVHALRSCIAPVSIKGTNFELRWNVKFA